MRKLGNPGANQYEKRGSFIVMVRKHILKEKSEKILLENSFFTRDGICFLIIF
jgi:hypothetical protein